MQTVTTNASGNTLLENSDIAGHCLNSVPHNEPQANGDLESCVNNDEAENQHNSKAIYTFNNPSSRPIGLFDSGVGGLSVYMHLKKMLPNERYVYYADTLNVPYGTRSSKEITELTLKAVDWLVQVGCKLVVIACNSASAHALTVVRKYYPDIPIVGLVPALKPAVLNSKSKVVAVLATQATLEGALLNQVIADYAVPANVDVIKSFDPNLVPWVESGMPTYSETGSRLKAKLHQFAKQNVDYLVLGCTHYPFFRKFVMNEVAKHGLDINIVDSGSAIAMRVKQLLSAKNQLASTEDAPLSNELYIGLVNFEYIVDMQKDVAKSVRLAFFVTDPKSNFLTMSETVKRLIYKS